LPAITASREVISLAAVICLVGGPICDAFFEYGDAKVAAHREKGSFSFIK